MFDDEIVELYIRGEWFFGIRITIRDEKRPSRKTLGLLLLRKSFLECSAKVYTAISRDKFSDEAGFYA